MNASNTIEDSYGKRGVKTKGDQERMGVENLVLLPVKVQIEQGQTAKL